MSDKITKKYAFAASDILSVESDDITIDVEDRGTFSFKKILAEFDGKAVKVSVSYDEDYEEQGPDNKKVNTATGEILDI